MSAPTKNAPAPARTDYRKLVERDFLGQWDLAGPDGRYREAVVQIERVTKYVPRDRKTVLNKESGQREPERLKRLKFTFVGKRKRWLAGPVSQAVIAGLFGPIIQDWIGKRIALYVDPSVRFGGKTTGGLRVRPKSPDSTVPLTQDPLDNEVDEDKANEIAEAADEWADAHDDEVSP